MVLFTCLEVAMYRRGLPVTMSSESSGVFTFLVAVTE